jgi:hypothetical protein
MHKPITSLPPELLHELALHLSLSDIVALAAVNKAVYQVLLGTGARDTLAKAYMHSKAPWCLPYGEEELKWWNERKGDDQLGWEYLKRCWCQSHSMRNRKRIWRAAESIEEECERDENERAKKA